MFVQNYNCQPISNFLFISEVQKLSSAELNFVPACDPL